jgi:hypothetical protein
MVPQDGILTGLPCSFMVTPAGVAQLEPSAQAASASTTVGTAFSTTLAVQALDAFGNPIGGVPVTFTEANGGSGAGGSFTGNTTVTTANNGVATAPPLTANDTAGIFTVRAGVANGVSTPFTLTNMAGPATTIVPLLGMGQSVTVGTAYSPLEGMVTDKYGNAVSGADVAFIASAGSNGASASFTGNSSVSSDAAGVAMAPLLTAGQVAGSFLVSAKVSGANTPATFQLSNTAGAPAAISVAGGTGQSTTVGSTYSTLLQAEVVDSFGNPVAGAVVTFTTPAAGPSGVFDALSSVPTNVLGIATAPALMANTQAGTFTIAATVAGVAGAADFSLTSVAGPVAALVASAGNSQSTVVGKAYQTALVAQVADQDHNSLQAGGVKVTFTIVPSGRVSGSFAGGKSSVTVTTNAQGIATAPALMANTHAGSFTVTATAAGLTKTIFTLTSTSAGAARIALMKMPGANASSGKQQTATPLEAVVTDRYGNVVSGVEVTFTIAPNAATGASATFDSGLTATVTTDSRGHATAPALKTNGRHGRFKVTASSAGLAETATALLTGDEVVAL